VGGSFAGLVSGGLLDGIIAHGDAPYASPLVAILLGAGTYYTLQIENDSDVNQVLISLFGLPVLDAKRDITQSITSKVQTTRTTITNLPTTIKTTIKSTIENTIAGVKRKINTSIDDAKSAANKKVEDTKAEV
jgi:hypothetical protein